MTTPEVRELFAYNAWANRLIFTALGTLPAEPYFRDLRSSHGGLHGTVCHIVWAEDLWLSRWLGRAKPAVAQGKDLPSLAAAVERWERIDSERGAFLATVTERRLDETITVQPSTGGAYVHTYHQMLRHAVDHSSYHRGQIVTMLRQVGVTPPSTGLIVFYRTVAGSPRN